LLPIDFSKITEIRYHRDSEDEDSDAVTMVLRKDTQWRLVSPIEEKADPVAVENFLKALKDYRYANVISTDPARHAEYSVADDGPRRVTLVTEDKETTLLIGTEAA